MTDAGARALLKPMVFAKLLQAAAIGEGDRVLDVGCATGYSAAVLAQLAGACRAGGRSARSRAARRDSRGAARQCGGRDRPACGGLARQGAPYDVILLEGACEVVPEALLAPAQGGRAAACRRRQRTMGKATIYRKAAGGP